jgi:hypothetical protein
VSLAKDTIVVSQQKKFIDPCCYSTDLKIAHVGIKHRSQANCVTYLKLVLLDFASTGGKI